MGKIYILIAIATLALIMLLPVFMGKKMRKQMTPLASIAFSCIVAGIIFGENRLIGYSLMGGGIILAVIDVIRKMKKKA